MRLNDRSPVVQHEPKIKYRLGRFHARLTAKGGGGLAGRKVELGDCLVLARKKTLREHKSPSHTQRSVTGKDLVSQLDIYAVSLSDRILGYEPGEVGSTPTLRATPMRQIGIL